MPLEFLNDRPLVGSVAAPPAPAEDTTAGKSEAIQSLLPTELKQVTDLFGDSAGTGAAATQAPSEDKGGRYKVWFRVKVGTLEFSNLKGDFLGQPRIRLSTYQHSNLTCVINDPDDQLRSQILKQQDVEVELGFVDGPRQNVFVGKLYSVGRRPPDGTEIVAVDPSFQMQQSTGSSVQSAASKPANSTATPAFTPDQQKITEAFLPEQLKQIKAVFGSPSEASTTDPTASTTDPAALTTDPAAVTPTPSATDQAQGQAALQQSAQPPLELGFSSTGDISDTLSTVVQATTQGKPNVTPAEQFASGHNLKFADDRQLATGAIGSVRIQQNEMQAAVHQAMLQGDSIVTRGNTVRQIAPGQGESSGAVIDYVANRALFIGKPTIFKRMGLQLQSGFGAVTVQGWSVNDKKTVGATVVTQAPPGQHPTGVVNVPEWSQVKLADPIVPGCPYTWGDATREGERVPESKQVMEGIVNIAQKLQQLSDRVLGAGQKFQINSWYRDPATNLRVASSGASGPHTTGSAVDFFFDGPKFDELFNELDGSWEGGCGDGRRLGFIHIDLLERRRWPY